MDAPPMAPPVVAVIVTADPDEWFEETLAAFNAQDYPNLSILVLDVGRDEDATARVAGVLPGAYVRRLAAGTGFGEAANHVFQLVKDAAYLVFAHDDAAPEPDAVRILVEEALRSNAGVVGPKIVDWFDPERLLSVGVAPDKTGQPAQLVERHELDQEQYDAVRDVFAISSTCMLIRSDLFTGLAGFDTAMTFHGEEVDFCWRAQIAGARVLVAPNARVRHLEDGVDRKLGPGPDSVAHLRLAARHRLRAVLKNYGAFHLIRVLPQAAVISLAEVVVALLGGHWGRARVTAAAWSWNFRRLGELRHGRKLVRRTRTVPDSEVRRLQVRGSARLSAYIRGQVVTEQRVHPVVAAGRNLRASLRTRSGAAAAVAAVAGVAVILLGSRDLFSGRIAAVGQLANYPRAVDFLREYVSGWRTAGLGSAAPAPPAFLFLGLAGVLLLGHMGVLRRLLIVGAGPAALLGMWRLTRSLGSTRARLVAVAVTAAIPLPYNALARGRWAGLVAYAAFPWLLAALLSATGAEPFGRARSSSTSSGLARSILLLGVGVGLAGALAPAIGFSVLVVGLLLTIGMAVSEHDTPVMQPLIAAVGGVALGAVLLFPWSLRLLTGLEWSAVGGVAGDPSRAFSLGALLRFQTGPLGAAPLGWAFLAAGALPLLIGRGWRLAWAVRMWIVAVGCVLVAWASGLGWLPTPLRTPEVLLAPAAIALVVAAALGVVAFETDLPGYRFGWRQVASVVAGTAAVLGSLPVIGAVVDGRWKLAANDPVRALSWMGEAENRTAGAFRVLWIGDGDVLPLDGWKLGGGGAAGNLAYATSRDGPPDAIDSWPGPSGTSSRIGDAVNAARSGDTTRLGHLLAPMAVRYIVVCQSAVPGREGAPLARVPASLTQALESQIDLRQRPSDPRLVVYESTAWGPGRAEVPGEIPTATPRAGVDLSDARPVLRGGGPTSFSGEAQGDAPVFVSESSSPQWKLRVGGQGAVRSRAYGWANAYSVESGGRARLRFSTPLVHFGALAIQLALWLVVIREVVRNRRRRRHLAVTPAPDGDGS